MLQRRNAQNVENDMRTKEMLWEAKEFRETTVELCRNLRALAAKDADEEALLQWLSGDVHMCREALERISGLINV